MTNGNEDVARALGAESPEPFTINGKRIQPRPLSLKELTELQRDCVRCYCRNYLQQYRDGLAVAFDDPKIVTELIVEEAKKVARWDVDDLPTKAVYDTRSTNFTPELEFWAESEIPGYPKGEGADSQKKMRYLAHALDTELLSESKFTELTGSPPVKLKTAYVNWWITGEPEGMLALVWHMVKKDSGFTREELEEALAQKHQEFVLLSRQIESLSSPDAEGNG